MKYIEIFNPRISNKLSEEPTIADTASIINSKLGKYTEVMNFVEIIDSSLDNYTYVCDYSMILYAEIGKFVSIAAMTRINAPNHPYERASQHHFTYRPEKYGFGREPEKSFFNWRKLQKVVVGNDVWIGHGSVILPGVNIGNGAIIGSLSVVTKDVAPYSIVAGNPARFIRNRFPKDIANAIEKTKWWDWPHEVIKERLEDFKDIRKFLYKYS
ncbi:MAG: hypothetical protein N2258_07280 [Brevinematales bacterium]|nr:hypothetical protein [Brevinematales bacterium]